MDFVFTVCDSEAGEARPVWPGQPIGSHWGVEDPAAVEGGDVEKGRAFNQALRYLRNRISAFVALPLKSLDAMALKAKISEIARLDGASAKAGG